MMKKLTRAALLGAATVFVLAGMTACFTSASDIDGNGDDDQQDVNVRATTGALSFADKTAAWVQKFESNTITKEDGTRTLDKSGDISISLDALSESTDGLTLVILAEKAWSGATQPNYSYASPEVGLRIKNPALKIADVKGKVKVTIEWACIKGKAAGDRKLQLLKEGGTVIKEAGNDDTSTATDITAMTPFTATVSCGNGTDLYIGGTDNVFIKSVKIEEAAPADVENSESNAPEDEDTEEEDDEYLGEVITLSALDWESNLNELTAKTNWPSHTGFAIVASSSNKVTPEEEDSNEAKQKKVQLESEAKTIKNRIKMGGQVKDDGRYIEMPLTGACKISIWALGGGSTNTGRCVQIAAAATPTTVIKKSEAVAGSSNTIEAVTIKMSDEDIAKSADGLFALGGDAGINIYYITIQYKE